MKTPGPEKFKINSIKYVIRIITDPCCLQTSMQISEKLKYEVQWSIKEWT